MNSCTNKGYKCINTYCTENVKVGSRPFRNYEISLSFSVRLWCQAGNSRKNDVISDDISINNVKCLYLHVYRPPTRDDAYSDVIRNNVVFREQPLDFKASR